MSNDAHTKHTENTNNYDRSSADVNELHSRHVIHCQCDQQRLCSVHKATRKQDSVQVWFLSYFGCFDEGRVYLAYTLETIIKKIQGTWRKELKQRP